MTVTIRIHDIKGTTRNLKAGFVPCGEIAPLYIIKEPKVRTNINQQRVTRTRTVHRLEILSAIRSPANGESSQTVKSVIRITEF
jgi:hypothetical protein